MAAEARIQDTVNFRYNRLIEGLLERFGDEMSLRCREYLMALVGRRPDNIVITEWDIPALEGLIEYQTKALKKKHNIHALGTWGGEALVVDGVGRVEVWNEEVDIFKNIGDMVIHYNATVSSTLKVGVLGGIIGYAMGVLIDMDGCLWFANPPGAIGNYLVGEEGEVMLIKKDGKPVKGSDEINVLEVYDKVDFYFEEFDLGCGEEDSGGEEEEF